jgi:hypothetical protein
MPINLLAENRSAPINLLAEEPEDKSFEELSPEEQDKSLEEAKQKIAAQYPNMPQWMQDTILNMAPKNNPAMLGKISKAAEDVGGFVPAIAGGALQGASIPIRGIASMLPGQFSSNLANAPDLTKLFPEAKEQGHRIAQLGSEILGGGGLFGKLMQGVKGSSALAKVPQALQAPLSLGGAGYIATPGTPTQKTQGAMGALALGGLGNIAGKAISKVEDKLPEFIRGLTTKSTPEALIESVQKPHDILQSTADDLYGQVRNAVKNRGITIPIKDEHLSKIEDILPKTRANKVLIDKARSGDYQATQDLQSHLYKKGTKALSSGDIAQENQGEEILDLRDKINDEAEQHMIKEGHLDVAHLLKQGKKVYAQLKDTYFNKNLPKGIGKLVHPETRLEPENPEKLFNQKSESMKSFLQKHPEASAHSKQIKEKKEAIKKLNSLMIKGAGAGGVTIVAKTIHDLFK